LVAPLALRVLESATEPMTAKTVTQEILRRFGEQPAYDSVRHVLRFGKEPRLGHIEPAGNGRYCIHS
jgi:repressor of nif and glnA expression